MTDCLCCGQPVIGDDTCEGCLYNYCHPAETWHCFTGFCDGSGCTYAYECEGLEDVQD